MVAHHPGGPAGAEAVLADYFVQSFLPIERAAEALAGEQSTGTFVRVPGETDELRERHAATIVALEPLEALEGAVLPGALRPAGAAARLSAARVRVAFPLRNFGPSIPNLLTAVAGNLFELRELASVKLLDLHLPPAFGERYGGPRFGIDGTRGLTGVRDRPLIGTIIKPSIGLDAPALARLVRELVRAGIDFIKDDELQGDPLHLPFAERVRVVMREVLAGAEATGRKVMYAFNLTGEIDEMRRRHDYVVAEQGICVMACATIVGLPALEALRRDAAVPIHAHRAMLGALMRSPGVGVDFVAYQKLARLCGADHLHTSALGNKFYESDAEVVRSIRAVLSPLDGGQRTLPVLSSGQSPRTMPATYDALGTPDLLILAGGGILAHPHGVAAGVDAMRQAWAAAVEGTPLAEAGLASRDLALALETFGGA
jgi:ribulose-bisphosphate carboxylase large chain